MPNSGHPSPMHAPNLAPLCLPHSVQSQLERACAVWLVAGPDAHNPRAYRKHSAGPGCLPKGRAVREGGVPNPGHPSPRHGPPPRATWCRPHSAQSQLARACAVELNTDLPTHTRRAHGKQAAGPGRLPKRSAVGRGRVPYYRHPSQRHKAPPGALLQPPQSAKPARKSARCGVGDGSPGPHTAHPWKRGSGPRPPAPSTGGSGREGALLRTPLTQARGAPPGRPRAAPTERYASSQERELWGSWRVPWADTPCAHRKQAAGPSRLLQGRAVEGSREPNPGQPTERHEAPPLPAPVPPPHRARPARRSARCGTRNRFRHLHPPRPRNTGS